MPPMTSSPAWALFRADLKRRWRGRALWVALAVFAVLLLAQAALTVAVTRFVTVRSVDLALWLNTGLAALGLYSPFLGTQGGVPGIPGLTLYYRVATVLNVGVVAQRFLLPAYAAASIAPERRERRLQELILAGLPPGHILLAKGAASLLPLLALVFFAWGGALGVYAYGAVAGSTATYATGVYSSLPDYAQIAAVSLLLFLPGVLLDCVVLVSISALCRHPAAATALCYTVQILLWAVLNMLTFALSSVLWVQDPTGPVIFRTAALLALKAAIAVILLRRALQVVAYPEDPARASLLDPAAT
jgi:hypothetical protein